MEGEGRRHRAELRRDAEISLAVLTLTAEDCSFSLVVGHLEWVVRDGTAPALSQGRGRIKERLHRENLKAEPPKPEMHGPLRTP